MESRGGGGLCEIMELGAGAEMTDNFLITSYPHIKYPQLYQHK